jgi:hypothetical protein
LAERGGFELSRPFLSHMLPRAFTRISFLPRETLASKRDSPKVVNVKVGQTAGGRTSRGLAVARETSDVCVHPEKERERMKCLLSGIESLSAEIENLGNLGRERLDLNAVAPTLATG